MRVPAAYAAAGTLDTPDILGMLAGTVAAPAARIAADTHAAPAASDMAGMLDRLDRSAAVAVLLAVAHRLYVAARSSLEPRLVVSPSSLFP